MTPWDLIVWAFAAGGAVLIVGFPLALVVLMVTVSRGKI